MRPDPFKTLQCPTVPILLENPESRLKFSRDTSIPIVKISSHKPTRREIYFCWIIAIFVIRWTNSFTWISRWHSYRPDSAGYDLNIFWGEAPRPPIKLTPSALANVIPILWRSGVRGSYTLPCVSSELAKRIILTLNIWSPFVRYAPPPDKKSWLRACPVLCITVITRVTKGRASATELGDLIFYPHFKMADCDGLFIIRKVTSWGYCPLPKLTGRLGLSTQNDPRKQR